MYSESSLTDANSVSMNGDQQAPFADFYETRTSGNAKINKTVSYEVKCD